MQDRLPFAYPIKSPLNYLMPHTTPTASPTNFPSIQAEDRQVAHLAALAIGLTLLELGIPLPIAGIKPGLANIITLVVLQRYGWRIACWVALLRILGSGLMMGSFLSPGFFLSLGGGIASLCILSLSIRLPARWFGQITHSLLAAQAHIAAQLAIVYVWLIPQQGILYLVPIFASTALLFGALNGWIAEKIASTLDNQAMTHNLSANTCTLTPSDGCKTGSPS
jgi:heptaprenyl diphosphate synthase